ncbi:MAG: purine/pyrimidine permease [Thermodesulfobacteriota bacterium]
MKLRFGLDDRMPAAVTASYALQWLALSLPFVVISGTIAADHHALDPGFRTVYLQKAAFAAALLTLGQAFFGHRLTLVAGPASALLLGILGSRATPDAVYTAAGLCGALLALLSAAGLFDVFRGVFTRRVTATVVLLIAFTLAPTIARLLAGGSAGTPSGRLAFAGPFVFALFLAHRFLPAAVRPFLIVGGMAAGAAAFFGMFGTGEAAGAGGRPAALAPFFSGLTRPEFDPGTIVSFLFCFLAFTLNEIGSMQGLKPLLRPDGMERRTRRGMTVAGIANVVAGALGVIGPVDYTLSPGVIAASGCGSRFPLVPAAVLLLLASFSPAVLGAVGAIPPTVIGGILVYTLAGQVAAGMIAAFQDGSFRFEDGLVIGLPLLAGTVTAFLPAAALEGIPAMLRPVAGNGFVVGIVTVLVLDRLFRERQAG